jgi:putative transposase
MPRSARLDAPGVLHHIMIRGIERRPIFKADQDREDLLERLSALLPDTQTACYAWAFLPNHAHFLFRSGPAGIPVLMRRLLTGYAVSFNRRHRRHGQLFQNRYKSVVCQEDAYLQELVRYIHLNPLRAKLVEDVKALSRYAYSGHSALMGRIKRPWQETDYVLSFFGRTLGKARLAYGRYVESGIGQGRRKELSGGGLIRSLGGWEEVKRIRGGGSSRVKGDERILGDTEFVLSILAESEERLERRYELKRKGYDIKRVEKRVEEILGVQGRVIYSRGRTRDRVEARSLFCYWAVRELGLSNTSIARKLGMSQPAVGYAVGRGEELARERGLSLER